MRKIYNKTSFKEKINFPFLTVVVFGGKTFEFSRKDVIEQLENLDMYIQADNLAGWIQKSMIQNGRAWRPLGFDSVEEVLETIVDYNSTVINVRSDAIELNGILILD